MSKIKFNIEWFKDNDIAINCKTMEESETLHKELQKLKIDDTYDISIYYHNYLDNTCYDMAQRKFSSRYEVFYSGIECYMKKGYTIIKFSDLEFEDEIVENKPKISKTENKECGYDLPVEVNKSIKKTILRGEVKLKEGDIVHAEYKGLYKDGLTGIVTPSGILYVNGGGDICDSIQIIIDNELQWYIPSRDIKDKSLHLEASKLLFKGELFDELKDLITYVVDKPKKVKVATYEVGISSIGTKHRSLCTSDNQYIEIGDIASIDEGLYAGRYGIVTNIKYEELTEDELKLHSKITKIK